MRSEYRNPIDHDGHGHIRHNRWLSLALRYAILFAFWLMLSGRYDTSYLAIGALSVGVVVFLNRDIFRLRSLSHRRGGMLPLLVIARRWLAYLGWLLYAIVVANIQVAYLVLHPRMPSDPVLIRFSVRWLRPVTQVVLANSITLTPGTVTVDLRDNQYTVHTLAPSLSKPLASGEMQRRVAAVFGEETEEAAAITLVRSVGALEP